MRTLVIAQDLGGFGRAAWQLKRTPSAISLQMKRLQSSVGATLFARNGRTLMLTEQGDVVLRYAQRILELNDEMLDSVRGALLCGTVRAGFAQDFVETVLPHALTLGEAKYRTATKLAELPLGWIASPSFVEDESQPLPLVLFAHPCIFRSRALDALQQARRAWRIALTSPSLSGLWAAVHTNLGITVRARTGAPHNTHFSLPNLPDPGGVDVALHYANRGKATHVRRFAEIVQQLFNTQYAINSGERYRKD